MTAHSPDERLSAFYDGELSAVERAEVERLVTAQPGLRAELSTLTGLSQQLSDLADDLPEIDLRPRVMQRIAGSRPVTGPGDVPPRRRWMPLALLVCSLALLVAAVLPLLPLSNQTDLVANNDTPAPSMSELAGSMRAAAASPEMSGDRIAANDSPRMGEMPAKDGAGFGGSARGLTDNGENDDGTGPSELLARIERRRDLKPGDIVSQMVEGGDVPMIADYTVIDVRRSARDVEFLLRKNSIVPLLATDRREDSDSTRVSERSTPSIPSSEIIKVYLVDAESASLNTAMVECQNLQEVVALNYLPLGLNAAGEAQLASLNGPPVLAADAVPTPAGSAQVVPAPAAALMRSAVAEPGSRAAGETVSKEGPVARKSMAGGQLPLDGAMNPVDKIADDVARSKEKVVSLVNGNSIVIENGDEFYSEIMQRQVQSLRNADRGSPVKQQQNFEVPAIARSAPATQALEALSNPNPSQQFDGRQGSNGLIYSNVYNGGRSRQRAILVLRSQSPPPPPEATRLPP